MTTLPFDITIIHFIQSFQTDWLTSIMRGISDIGSIYGYLFIVPIVAGFLYFRTPYRFEGIFSILINVGGIFSPLFKLMVGRERPPDSIVHVLVQETSASFPSGHALSATIFYGFLLYLLTSLPVSHKRLWVFILVSIILLIGISRVYLGVHWPTDVLGGYIIGVIWLAFGIYIYKKLRKRFVKST